MNTLAADSPCPCGSGGLYTDCCRVLHAGVPAASPEALMRSRYSPYCLYNADYLLATWHSSSRPDKLDFTAAPAWTGLRIFSAKTKGDRGQVHFQAIHALPDGWGYLEERSGFAREEGRWYYVTGKVREGRLKPGRNDPCPCGSGRKFKACGCWG